MSVRKTCPDCRGAGELLLNPDAPSFAETTIPCLRCDETGQVNDDGQCDHGGTEEVCPYCESCHSCGGDCWYAVEERSAELSADLARDIREGF